MQQVVIKNKRLAVDYCGIGWYGWLKFQVIDSRPLSMIAPDVEGADTITHIEDDTQTKYEGYTQLMRIERVDVDHCVVILQNPEAKNGNV